MKELLILFIICNIANVIIQTIKSLATIKGTPLIAATVNAVAYGFYTYIIIITNCDLPVWQKMVIVALCNLIGVYVVKKVEDKARKDKLWKIEVTVPVGQAKELVEVAKDFDLSFNYTDIQKYYLFNFYCPTQNESKSVKDLLKNFDCKYFVTESKVL